MNEEEKKVASFKLELDEAPVKLGGEQYVLKELDGRTRDKYLNTIGGRVKTGVDGKPVGVKNFDGLQATLVSLSLYKVEGTGDHTPVALDIIQKFPAKVIKKLFKMAKELSALDDDGEGKGEDDLGNE